MLPISIHSICGQTAARCVNKFAGNLHDVLREYIHIFEIAEKTIKVSILENSLAPVEEIGYFIFYNSNVVPPIDVLSNSTFIFDVA